MNSIKQNKPDSTYFGVFSESFREHVHILIAEDYSFSLSKITSDNNEETDITGYITEGIEQKYNNRESPRWCSGYVVKEDNPQNKQGYRGKNRLKPDIIIEKTVMRGRPEYILEAKRLNRSSNHAAGVYIGKDGMERFIDGRYGERYGEAGMIGYVQSDSLSVWKEKIQKAIYQKKDRLNLKSEQKNVNIIKKLPYEWKSEHERTDNNNILIFHILLAYSKKASTSNI
ncbi:MAG: hypothetical protein JRJ49_10655 [Deltaproteobacteria bacterium]|nr:hypothetical protein [Deltaproteobacteria bacterium]